MERKTHQTNKAQEAAEPSAIMERGKNTSHGRTAAGGTAGVGALCVQAQAESSSFSFLCLLLLLGWLGSGSASCLLLFFFSF